ncbi:aldehyde reductase [Mycena olivaceomarginata]|nr:aldehyde reductase [Mycena olivaceomarginata]
MADGNSVKAVFGGYSIGPAKSFPDEREYRQGVQAAGGRRLRHDRHRAISTATRRSGWEKTGAGKRFIIDSKTPGGFVPGTSTGAGILQHAKETVERLQVQSVSRRILHHAPDASLDLEDQLKGINEAHKAATSSPRTCSAVYDIAKAKGYPLPAVYQANYNPVARKQEVDLVPTLRRLGIAFYGLQPHRRRPAHQDPRSSCTRAARAPAASQRGHQLEGRYNGLYNKPSYYRALDLWGEAAEEAGASRAELAYRWVAFDSAVDAKYGDAVVFGASKHAQIPETLAWLKRGSVGEAAKAKIDEIWKVIEHEAPLDNYNQ